MIFLYVGLFLMIIGISFRVFPPKSSNRLYGYRSFYAEKSEMHWQYAQKISGNMFLLMGSLMAGIGWILKVTGHTNFFVLEMIFLVFPIIPIFTVTESKLKQFDQQSEEHAE